MWLSVHVMRPDIEPDIDRLAACLAGEHNKLENNTPVTQYVPSYSFIQLHDAYCIHSKQCKS